MCRAVALHPARRAQGAAWPAEQHGGYTSGRIPYKRLQVGGFEDGPFRLPAAGHPNAIGSGGDHLLKRLADLSYTPRGCALVASLRLRPASQPAPFESNGDLLVTWIKQRASQL